MWTFLSLAREPVPDFNLVAKRHELVPASFEHLGKKWNVSAFHSASRA